MEKNYNKATKIFLAVQAFFAIGALMFFYFSSSSDSGAPIVGQSIFEPDVTFELGDGEQLLISDNADFENPFIFEKDSEIQLSPGIYYWKIKSWKGESEAKSFTVYNRASSDKDDSEDAGEKSGITSIVIDTGNSVEIGGENGN